VGFSKRPFPLDLIAFKLYSSAPIFKYSLNHGVLRDKII